MANSPYTLFTLAAAGPTLTAGTAASMLVAASPAVGQLRGVVPANWIGYGTRITYEASGILTTAATPGSGTWDVRLGSTVVATTGAVPLTASMSSWKWRVFFDMVARSVGATTAAQFWTQGYLQFGASATTDTTLQHPYNTNPPTLGTGFDSTVQNTLDAFFTETLSTATFICEQACAVIWNPNY